MEARNMNELNSMLKKELRKCMELTSIKMLGDMYESTGKFYTVKPPKKYIRTGALGDTPSVTSIKNNRLSFSFNAFLDLKHRYSTGANPTMLDVLNLANYGITNSSVGKLRPTLGKKGFWEDALNSMEYTFDETFSYFFN